MLATEIHDSINNVSMTLTDGNTGTFLLLEDMYIERGTIDDWKKLHKLHYKGENLPPGTRIYRCVLNGETIGVSTISYPRLTLKQRRLLFPNLKTGGDSYIMNSHRAKWLNKYFGLNARVVVDTLFRGAGIAYRMQNLSFRMSGVKYVEFMSSMSKYNKFAEKAGVRLTKPVRSNTYEKGLEFFRRHYESDPTDYVEIMEELNRMSPTLRKITEDATRAFYRQNSTIENKGVGGNIKAEESVAKQSTSQVIKNLQQLVFASPVYGVYINPDFERTLPERIPLLAFDKQGVNQPLCL